MSTSAVLSVSQLNRYIKSLIDGDFNLQSVFVCGEISNFTNHYKTGHYYMTLKDETAAIKAVMFRSANERLKFTPENNMRVIVKGRVSVFERDGQYQLYIDDMQPDGAGALSVAFEQLKARLEAQGLFDAENKKEIPFCPSRVGVITSPTGAAVRDIINVLSRRFPAAEMVFCPVTVQGDRAAPEIVQALNAMNAHKAADVIILGRGGGSIEDLWAFNEEIVARAVYASEIPVISAVGHETDFTICDFVADLRAPTPSAAAELAVPDAAMQKEFIYKYLARLRSGINSRFSEQKHAVALLTAKIEKNSPAMHISDLRIKCDTAIMAMDSAVKADLAQKNVKLASLCAKLDAMSPLKILSRGFAVASKEGKIIKNTSDVCDGDLINVRIAHGTLECRVTGKEN